MIVLGLPQRQHRFLFRRKLSLSGPKTRSDTLLASSLLSAHAASSASSSSSSSSSHVAAPSLLSSTWQISAQAPCHLIFGANTDVGKTIVSTGLVRASLVHDHQSQQRQQPHAVVAHYIKPLQSGGSDCDFVHRYAASLLDQSPTDPQEQLPIAGEPQQRPTPRQQRRRQLVTTTLFEFEVPASPHLASVLEGKPVSDCHLLESLHQSVMATTSTSFSHAQPQPTTFTWIETAGGVLSPAAASPDNNLPRHSRIEPIVSQSTLTSNNNTILDASTTPLASTWSPSLSSSWGWTTQADLYQPLLGYVPVVLVGDGRLGGISATLSALESLMVRGYDIAAVVLIEPNNNDDKDTIRHDNVGAIRAHVSRALAMRSGSGQALLKDNLDQSVRSLPPIPADREEPLHEWFESDLVQETFQQLHNYLYQSWQGHVADLQEMIPTGQRILWWPFTQHANIPDPCSHPNQITLINSASGDEFHVLQERSTNNTDQGLSSQRQQPQRLAAQLHSTSLVDACASWWTQGLGHGDSSLALASAAAAGRYGHVLFPQNVHAPALQLSQRILETAGANWASRVFFSDNGSTAMEIAIKMGLRLFLHRHHPDLLREGSENGGSRNDQPTYDLAVAAQSGCYHGDTLGTMNVAEPSIWNERQHPWYEPKALSLDVPTLAFQKGILQIDIPEGWEVDVNDPCKHHHHHGGNVETIAQAMDVQTRMKGQRHLYIQYKELIEMQWLVYEHSGSSTSLKGGGQQRQIGSIVLEPVLMGAGGMKFVDPLWQRALIDVAKSKKVPVVFDEVAVGIYRLGVPSCRAILQTDPDVAAYAKLLTGGLVPMAVTLATEEVFEAFWGDEVAHSLLHGHSYTAHPVGCVSAIHALDAYHEILLEQQQQPGHAHGPRMQFDEQEVKELSRLPLVRSAFALGSVLAVTIEPDDDTGGYGASSRTVPLVQQLRHEGIYARPLGNVIYIMVSPLTRQELCQQLTTTLHRTIETFGKSAPTLRYDDRTNII